MENSTHQKISVDARGRPQKTIRPTFNPRFLDIEDKHSSANNHFPPLCVARTPDDTRNQALLRCENKTKGMYSVINDTKERLDIGVDRTVVYRKIHFRNWWLEKKNMSAH
jgi:hypothetical protein